MDTSYVSCIFGVVGTVGCNSILLWAGYEYFCLMIWWLDCVGWLDEGISVGLLNGMVGFGSAE